MHFVILQKPILCLKSPKGIMNTTTVQIFTGEYSRTEVPIGQLQYFFLMWSAYSGM